MYILKSWFLLNKIFMEVILLSNCTLDNLRYDLMILYLLE